MAFLSSRVNPYAAVPNRYFGALDDGELKIRGIEARRRDTPAFIKNLQDELLAEMAKASARRELAAQLPHLLEIVAAQVDRLRAGQVPMQDLVLTYRLSRDPRNYQMDSLNATVAKELLGRGVKLEPGETIRFVITDYQAAVSSDRARSSEFLDGSWGYDVERYTELLLRGMETVLTPLGMNGQMLHGWRAKELPAQCVSARASSLDQHAYLGPLFELGSASDSRR